MASRLKLVKERIGEGPATWPEPTNSDSAIYGGTSGREFWTLSDGFIHAWTDLVATVKAISEGKYDHVTHDLSNIKRVMRDTQRAAKEVSRAVSMSSLYNTAVRNRCLDPVFQTNGTTFVSAARANFNGYDDDHSRSDGQQLPASIGATFVSHSQHEIPADNGHASGWSIYSTMPATPLSAALGPAAQATIAQTQNNSSTSAQEQVQTPLSGTSGSSGLHPPPQQYARMETVMLSQNPGGARPQSRR